MKLLCKACGNHDAFYAVQIVTGSIDVIVDRDGDFVINNTSDGDIDTSSLNFDEPEGPYQCHKCGSTDIVDMEDGEWVLKEDISKEPKEKDKS